MLEDMIKDQEPIHTRDISLSTYPYEKNGIIVHGILKDVRKLPIVDILGQSKDPGIVHHISVTLAADPDPLRIVLAEARMHTIPSKECPDTLKRISKLQGLEIKSGFSSRVRSILSGVTGCVHLTTLVTAMGTEILHGWMTRKRSSQENSAPRLSQTDALEKEIRERAYLIDSCRVWRKDGPRVRQMRKALDAVKK